MNVFTHDGHFTNQLRRARRFQLTGMALIIVSFTMSLGSFGEGSNLLLIYLAYPFLIIGFPLWTIGRTTSRRLKGAPRPDYLINAELKGLNDKYSLHHYVPVSGKVVPHLLVTPAGVIVMVTSDAVGAITCRGGQGVDRWRSESNFLDRLTGLKPAVGNPSIELSRALEAAEQVVSSLGKASVPARGLVLFTRSTDVQLDNCAYAAVPLNELKVALRELQTDMGIPEDTGRQKSRAETILTSEDRRKLNAALSPQVAARPARPAAARR